MKKLVALLSILLTATLQAAPQVYLQQNSMLRDRHLELNPVTGKLEPATLLEGYARTYIAVSDTTASVYQSNFAVVTGNVAGAPDGTSTAVKVSEDTNTVYHRAAFNALVATTGSRQSFAIYLKAGERSKVWFDVNTNSDGGTPYILNLLTGGIEKYGSATLPILRVSPVAAGWWLLELSFTSTSTGTSYVSVGNVNASGSTSYLGDGASGFYLWRPTYFTDQKLTSSSIQSVANGGGYLNPTPNGSENSYGTGRYPEAPFELDASGVGTPAALTGFIEFIEKGTAQTASAGVWYLGHPDAATGAMLYVSTGTNGYRVTHNNGSATVTSELAAFPSFGDLVRLRWVLNADGSVQIFQSINGRTETSSTASSANTLAGTWGATRLFLNGIGNTLTNVGYIAVRKTFVLSGSTHTLSEFTNL